MHAVKNDTQVYYSNYPKSKHQNFQILNGFWIWMYSIWASTVPGWSSIWIITVLFRCYALSKYFAIFFSGWAKPDFTCCGSRAGSCFLATGKDRDVTQIWDPPPPLPTLVSVAQIDKTMQNALKNQENCEINFNWCSKVSKDINFWKNSKNIIQRKMQ